MNIGLTVDCKPIVIRQLLAPFYFVAVNSPVVTVESAPKNCLAVLIQKLLGYYAAVIGFNIDNANSIIALFANRDGVSPHYIKQKILVGAGFYFIFGNKFG